MNLEQANLQIGAYKENDQILDAAHYLIRNFNLEHENFAGFDFRDETRAPERKPGLAPCKLAWRQRKKAATGAAFLNVTDSNLWLLPLAKIGQIFTPFMYWLYGYSEKRFHRIWSRWNARMSS